MSAHVVFITHRTKPSQHIAAEAVWCRILQPAIQANPDHLAYVYTLPVDGPDAIRAFQLNSTSDVASAFLRSPEYLNGVGEVDQHLDGPPVVASSAPAWVEVGALECGLNG